MSKALSAKTPPKLKPQPQRLSHLLPRTPDTGPRLEFSHGEEEITQYAGVYLVRRAWDTLGVDDLLSSCQIEKEDGIPASAVAFLQTVTPMIGRGTVISGIEKLNSDPLLPRFCGLDYAFGKDVGYRFLKDERFEFEALHWARVEQLQQIKEVRFERRGLIALDASLLRKTGKHFERIRHLYDHVTDSYIPAYDMLAMVYTDERGEIPVTAAIRTLSDDQHHYLQLRKAGEKGFAHLLRYAKSAERRTPVFIRPCDYSTAHLKQAKRAGLDWFAQISQNLPLYVDDEQTTPAKMIRRFKREDAFVRHEEIGGEAAGCAVRLPAYGSPVKLFAYREGPKRSTRVILASDPECSELDFIETLYTLRADFGDDKIDLALAMYQRLIDMRCPTRRTSFDHWFFVERFCKALHVMEFKWFTQAGDRDRFLIRGTYLNRKELIDRYLPKAKRVRRMPGVRAFKVRARWQDFGMVQLVIVEEDGRSPYVLVTNDLTVPIKGVINCYKRRWRVEVTFREQKQGLNLEGFRVRTLKAVTAHISLVFLAHTLLRIIAEIDEVLSGKSVGWLKNNVVRVIALVRNLAEKTGVEVTESFELFYLLDTVRFRKRRRSAHAFRGG